MGGAAQELTGPDFEKGIAFTELIENKSVLGHAHGEAVVVVRTGSDDHAIGASCTHYSGPLAEGLVVEAEGFARCRQTVDMDIGMKNFVQNGPRVPAAFMHE